jgi:EAL domain-containing protein (putative c-di-GMP-specific phosphodiesterase class I)
LVPPNDFLPVIENTQLSIAVGEWVIDSALGQMAAWNALGLDIPVSVNIGAFQLQSDGFAERLAAQLAEHPEVAPQSLELEVLETSELGDMAQVTDIMNACIALGVSFALDDFGTGYASLSYIRRLPAQMIKIDQTFIRDMLDDVNDLAIVESVIALAKSFKRDVIAEGVETIEHGSKLLKLGCELAQGYGIARPMPAKEFPAWTETWHPDKDWS